MSTHNDQIDFGYSSVPKGEKAKHVRGVFDSVAGKYDVMNDVMSMGIHRLWKRFAIDLCGVRRGEEVLDVAGGTGDLGLAFSKKVGSTGRVVISDINAAMLETGRDRLIDKGVVSNVEYVQANAECLPFPDNSFDCITIAFGLRNVTDKSAALASMRRILKPGGRVVVLEFSQVAIKPLRPAYDFYSFNVLPKMGKLIANDADSYQYLAESIRMHPNQETLKGMMEDVGLERAQYFNLSGGIAAIHRGYKF